MKNVSGTTLYRILKSGFEIRMEYDPRMRAIRLMVSKDGHCKDGAISDVVLDNARIPHDMMIFANIMKGVKDVELAIVERSLDED